MQPSCRLPLTKQKKKNSIVTHWRRSAPKARFCDYNRRMKCPLVKGGCPFQDYDFIEDLRFYCLWSRGLKSLPVQPRVDSENKQILETSQFIKLLETTFIFDTIGALDKIIAMLDAPKSQVRMTQVLCQSIRRAHRKWLMHLAPPGYRMVRYKH